MLLSDDAPIVVVIFVVVALYDTMKMMFCYSVFICMYMPLAKVFMCLWGLYILGEDA